MTFVDFFQKWSFFVCSNKTAVILKCFFETAETTRFSGGLYWWAHECLDPLIIEIITGQEDKIKELFKGCPEMGEFGSILLPSTLLENPRCWDEDLKQQFTSLHGEFGLGGFSPFITTYGEKSTRPTTQIAPLHLGPSCKWIAGKRGSKSPWWCIEIPYQFNGMYWQAPWRFLKMFCLILSWSTTFLFFPLLHLASSECKQAGGRFSSVHAIFLFSEYSDLRVVLQVPSP